MSTYFETQSTRSPRCTGQKTRERGGVSLADSGASYEVPGQVIQMVGDGITHFHVVRVRSNFGPSLTRPAENLPAIMLTKSRRFKALRR